MMGLPRLMAPGGVLLGLLLFWSPVNTRSSYYVREIRSPWQQATDTCTVAGGHLVVLDSATELRDVISIMKRSSVSRVFAGFTYSPSEDNAMDVLGKPLKQLLPWLNGRPASGTDRMCGIITLSGYDLQECSQPESFVCEKTLNRGRRSRKKKKGRKVNQNKRKLKGKTQFKWPTETYKEPMYPADLVTPSSSPGSVLGLTTPQKSSKTNSDRPVTVAYNQVRDLWKLLPPARGDIGKLEKTNRKKQGYHLVSREEKVQIHPPFTEESFTMGGQNIRKSSSLTSVHSEISQSVGSADLNRDKAGKLKREKKWRSKGLPQKKTKKWLPASVRSGRVEMSDMFNTIPHISSNAQITALHLPAAFSNGSLGCAVTLLNPKESMQPRIDQTNQTVEAASSQSPQVTTGQSDVSGVNVSSTTPHSSSGWKIDIFTDYPAMAASGSTTISDGMHTNGKVGQETNVRSSVSASEHPTTYGTVTEKPETKTSVKESVKSSDVNKTVLESLRSMESDVDKVNALIEVRLKEQSLLSSSTARFGDSKITKDVDEETTEVSTTVASQTVSSRDKITSESSTSQQVDGGKSTSRSGESQSGSLIQNTESGSRISKLSSEIVKSI